MKTSREKYLESKIVDAKDQLAKARSQRLLRCRSCERASRIGAWKLFIEEFYVRPHGCTGGDYWTEGDHPCYRLECPKCKHTWHLDHYQDEDDERKPWAFVNEYRYSFKGREHVRDG